MKKLVRVLLLLGLAAAACASPRRGENLGNAPVLDSASEQRGRAVFMRHCNACHVGGAGALGPAINDKPLPVFLVKFQVRRGLGAMPRFSKNELGDAELDDLMAYLLALRRAGGRESRTAGR
ncbi:cytochrome C [Sulfurifustis variabilis]|uniref:Cytochrome C n=1 Tax=Sulfurifustis variabilis TaxID=1675686 RepID=A0A1B4V804_9GAMM|nr:cytochrome c [Sulfurifustis variabilis]BAU49658.1 cytochrome C [Sulfurifustis variabilis]